MVWTKSAGDQVQATDWNARVVPPGTVLPYAARTMPSADWLKCDGSAVSRTTYSELFSTIVPSIGTFTVTLASPGVFTLNSHGLVAGDAVYLTTTGALPTGLSQNTIYFVIAAGLTANAFELAATRGGAAINTSGSQSGTHTLRHCPFGLGDGSTTFNVPNLEQRAPFGYKAADTKVGYLGQTGGEQTHVLTIGEMPAHDHSYVHHNATFGGSGGGVRAGDLAADTTGSTGGGTAHENMPPYITMHWMIKT